MKRKNYKYYSLEFERILKNVTEINQKFTDSLESDLLETLNIYLTPFLKNNNLLSLGYKNEFGKTMIELENEKFNFEILLNDLKKYLTKTSNI